MSGLVERLHEKIGKLHAGLNVHSVSKFKEVVSATWSICDEALATRAWQPYCSITETTYTLLEAIRDAAANNPTGVVVNYTVSPAKCTFKFFLPRGTDLARYLATELDRAKTNVDRFEQLFNQACKELKLDPWAIEGPSEGGNEQPLPLEGRFLVVLKKGVHLIDFQYEQDAGRISGDAIILTPAPIPYRDAMVKPHPGVLIEVRNADKYPLEDTVKPVLLNLYGSLFCDPN